MTSPSCSFDLVSSLVSLALFVGNTVMCVSVSKEEPVRPLIFLQTGATALRNSMIAIWKHNMGRLSTILMNEVNRWS
jgi:hypothetical protein